MAMRRLLDDHDDMDFKEVLLKHIAPGLGCIIAFLMFVSPLKAVLQVRASKHLGDLNPLPLVAIIANCAAWLLYGCINADPYVILANEPGLLLGVFMTVSSYGFADPRARDLMLKALLFFTVIISGAGITIALFVERDHTASLISGYTAVFVLLCYYGAPLSTISEVVRSRSSASLFWPISVMNTVNGLLWVAYGTAVEDLFIAVPNAIGATFGLIQLVLIQCYPAKKAVVAVGGDRGDSDPLLQDSKHVA
ncbi:hypothetical protein VOLCADRAFT_115772 [Volvox carteri f. nagariensis]|uniref:Bidirectional sugar transporter SWEET n=1 Tax=Volvox carteri f. nagariensis TaxID=3068 RepID=D8TI60_VOLCA|nr:uncharacterized protein VOLCADRAFT_115772 [Volvox carteri f. nagariensis]EFJ52839.1 hypothetical protein VOLCADRAFT_115772 [Volvox carteri f. nagariensis]|eukprot:XP_002945844.1 hypothetical protein VOLCADRAFT_115772 [Volvox carteri f. nagariensis]